MSEKFTIRYTTWAPPYTPDAPLRRGRHSLRQQASGGRKAAAGFLLLFSAQVSVLVAAQRHRGWNVS